MMGTKVIHNNGYCFCFIILEVSQQEIEILEQLLVV